MSKIILIMGVILMALGILASIYTITTHQSHLFGLFSSSTTISPYSIFSFPLLLVGVVVTVIGAILKD